MEQTVLVVGGTGRTGGRVLRQLLDRGVRVRAIVRSRGKLPADVAGNANLTLIEASLLSLRDDELQQHLRGCDAVISCLGHVLSLEGILGPPRDLVTRATMRLCRAVEALRPPAPVKLILMGSVSVNRPHGLDTRRTSFERAFLWMLRGVLPPAKDNQRAADFLLETIGSNNAFVQWVVVRPDTLLEGEVSEYTLHEGLVDGLFAPGSTNMANVAHVMCELATNPKTWADWKLKLPVIVNTAKSSASTTKRALGTVALVLALDAGAAGVQAQAAGTTEPAVQPMRVAVDWSAVRDADVERCGLSRLRAGTIERLVADGYAVVEAADASGVHVAVRSTADGLAIHVEGAGSVRQEELHAGTPCDPTFALDVVSRIAELVGEVAALAEAHAPATAPAVAEPPDEAAPTVPALLPERASLQAALDVTARLNTAPDYQLGGGLSLRARLGEAWESGLRAELTAHAAHGVTVLEAFVGLSAALQPELPGIGPYLELGPVLHVGSSDERTVTLADGMLAAGAQLSLGHFLGQLLVYGRLRSLEHRVGRKTAFETGHLGVLLRLGAQLSDS